MSSLFSKEILTHRTTLLAFGAVALIAVGSAAYFIIGTSKPAEVKLPSQNLQAGDITATGLVEPLENPNLSFVSGGRVAKVTVAVGDRVFAGETLASLDVSTLVAQRAQAEADLQAQQARLDSLKAGARDTDVAIKQAAVNQAEQALISTYASVATALSDAYGKAQDAVISQNSLFSNPNSANPTLLFSVSDSSVATNAVQTRIAAGNELSAWQTELAALSTGPTKGDLDAALKKGIAHLTVIRGFEDALISALNLAIPTTAFPQSSISSAQTAQASPARTAVNGLISALTADQQIITSEYLAIDAANASLAQLKAGASNEDIAAQAAAVDRARAAVSAVDAQIGNNIISAPFPGIVGSVTVKTADFASPNVPVITILPDSALEVSVRVTELDVARIKQGDAGTVTLDAFGSNRVFPAHVARVDSAPSVGPDKLSSYQVKLSFDTPSPDVKTGMTANVIISPSGASAQ